MNGGVASSRPAIRLSSGIGLGLALLGVDFCVCPAPDAAQSVTGRILGTVNDSTGAAVPGASITPMQTETALTRAVANDARGEYNAPSLPTGTCSIACEMADFEGVKLSSVRLRVDQKVRMDLALEVGPLMEVVTIGAQTPLAKTSSSDLGATIDETQIKTLPLPNRNSVFLARTIPGVRGTAGHGLRDQQPVAAHTHVSDPALDEAAVPAEESP